MTASDKTKDGGSSPTLTWRTVWPGEWTCDNAGYIWADSLKGGRTHMIDVRGWGYLTGGGLGALGLKATDAERLQDDLGRLLCAAPDMLASLQTMRDYVSDRLMDAMAAGETEMQGGGNWEVSKCFYPVAWKPINYQTTLPQTEKGS